MEWISVNDRLPDDSSWVLVYAGGATNCMMYANGGFYDPLYSQCHNIFIGDITHWMPLPEPPEQKKSPDQKPGDNPGQINHSL